MSNIPKNNLMENLTEMVSVVFSPSQMDVLQVAADREGRKVGNYIRYIVVRHLEATGYFDEVSKQEVVDIDEE
jgi:hypothetical protein